MFIHERISKLLLEKGLSQKDLSDYTGIKQSAISDWKRKNTNPSADAIIRISEYLGVTSDFLLTGKSAFTSTLDEDTQELVTNYIKLDSRGKTVVKAAVYHELDRLERGFPEVYRAARDGGGFERITDLEQARIASDIIESRIKSSKKLP